MIRIVLAHDHSMVRMGFKMLIMQQKDFEVVGEASDPNEAFELVKQLSPEYCLPTFLWVPRKVVFFW